MTAESAVGGFVVASGDFTSDARSFAEGHAIKLVHTAEMLKMVAKTFEDGASGQKQEVKSYQAKAPSAAIPLCPKCEAAMVLRRSKKFGAAGNAFFGDTRRFMDAGAF